MSFEGKRIAIFLPSLTAGGVGRVFVDLANGFAERGCSVEMLLSRVEGTHFERLTPDVKVTELARQGRFDTRRTILSLHPGPWLGGAAQRPRRGDALRLPGGEHRLCQRSP